MDMHLVGSTKVDSEFKFEIKGMDEEQFRALRKWTQDTISKVMESGREFGYETGWEAGYEQGRMDALRLSETFAQFEPPTIKELTKSV